ncbi:hypothetical protein MRX96_021434 [Rhipicephalus microplus]
MKKERSTETLWAVRNAPELLMGPEVATCTSANRNLEWVLDPPSILKRRSSPAACAGALEPLSRRLVPNGSPGMDRRLPGFSGQLRLPLGSQYL